MFEDIQRDVETIIKYSQAYPFDVDCEHLIHQWWKAKEDLFHGMQRRLVVRSALPIEVVLSPEECSRKFNEFLCAIDDYESTEDFEDFIVNNEEGFFDNRVTHACPQKGVYQGQKISKSFKRFITNREDLREIQDIASTYMQEAKVTGYLYLSIDPRDYLTMSENNNNWHSCQALDGDYRAGPLSYMVDDVTMVAYLADEKKQPLRTCGIEWNNKKWRMLVHMTKNCAYYSRQYPFKSDGLLGGVASMVEHVFNRNDKLTSIGYRQVKRDVGKDFLSVAQLAYNGRSFSSLDIINVDDYLGFSDLIYSNMYSPVAGADASMLHDYDEAGCYNTSIMDEYDAFKEIFGIKIGELPYCPCCGEEQITRCDSLLCDSCIRNYNVEEDFFQTCAECGRRIWGEAIPSPSGDGVVCSDCYKAIQQEVEGEEEEDGER